MLTKEEINKIYNDACIYFEKNHPELICTVEQDAFVAQLNWQNVTYFNGQGLTRQARAYRCVVKIYPNRTFFMIDVNTNNIDSIGLGGIKLSRSAFAGRSWNYNYEMVLGKDNVTGETGVLTYRFKSSEIQKPVKNYFKSLELKSKFFSYSLAVKALPKAMQVVASVVPLLCGIAFTSVGLFVSIGDKVIKIVFSLLGVIMLVWGIINLCILFKKDSDFD